MAEAPVDGFCAARFEDLREVFRDNFPAHDELGAAVAASVNGRVVVDLWGGWADRGATRPWRRETLANAFSVGNGFVALCAALLVERGALDLDAPVARLWPGFAAAGKDAVTARELLSHRAGLPAIREPLPAEALYDWQRMCGALAGQAPWWPPGSRHGYHVNSFGFLVGEVVRRASGRSVGRLLREDIAGPLGADFHIGLPAAEHERVAEHDWPDGEAVPVPPRAPDETELMRYNTYFNPPNFSGHGVVNTAAWRAAEIPSANGHGTARGVARIYAALAGGGRERRLLGPGMLDEAATEHACGRDAVLGERETRFGLGFQLPQPERPFAPGGGGFGHFGAGGSVGFADPDAGVAFGYVTNRMGARWQSPSARRLIDALYERL